MNDLNIDTDYLLELVNKPLVRYDQPFEFLNKMDDEELEKWYKNTEDKIKKENISGLDAGRILSTKIIDHHILYECLKLKDKTENNG